MCGGRFFLCTPLCEHRASNQPGNGRALLEARCPEHFAGYSGIQGASPSMTAAVETHDLQKRYPKVEALAGVSLTVEQGEIFALLGPNGAGKTTWISIVCGLTRASSGHARVLGHDVVDDAMAARRVVGLVPQEINFDPFFTPR